LESKELVDQISEFALQKKGKQIAVLNLNGLTSMTDYFVIITGDSDTHIKSIADHILNELKSRNVPVYHKEGFESLRWVLLDYVDVIVHIFRGETREFYSLERLWADAEIKLVTDENHDA